MSIGRTLTILMIVAGIATGQVLFKMAADSFHAGTALWKLVVNPYVIFAGVIYFMCTALWLWQLRFVELNKAYPIFATAFLMVPFFSWIFLHEKLSVSYFVGVLLIISGVILTTR